MQDKSAIGIVGTGMIGTGLAVLCTGNGYPVTIYTRSAASEARCKAQYAATFSDLAEHGLVKPEQVDICSRYLRFTSNYADFRDMAYVFECVTESLEPKYEVYRQLEQHCSQLKVLASTTSAFSAELLSEPLGDLRERFLVAHPFNPAHAVLCVELVSSPHTCETAVSDITGFLESLGRQVIRLKKDAPGFIANRLQYALFREAFNLVEQGIANPEDIDKTLNYSFMPRYTSIGLFEHLDLAGLDLFQGASGYLYPTLCNASDTPRLAEEKVNAGEFGCKSGRGIYQWDPEKLSSLRSRSAQPFLKWFDWDLPTE